MQRFLLILVFLLSLPFSVSATTLEPTIRVLVMDVASPLLVGTRRGGRLSITDSKSRPITNSMSATVVYTREGLRVNGRPSNSQEIKIESRDQFYTIGNRSFRGSLRILNNSKKISVINDVPIEIYLAGLIGSEISPNWPVEAIKAQVVAARTYAINQTERTKQARPDAPYDIKSTMLDQVYDGAHKEEAHVHKIVSKTRGKILTRNGIIYPTYYHSCCGGYTENAKNVWDNSDGPPAVQDRYCARSPKFHWTYKISLSNFQRQLAKNGVQLSSISSILTVPLFGSPRVDSVIIDTTQGATSLKATKLRSILGFSNLKSTWFEVAIDGNHLNFKGRGYGHGVGMCQWGAKGMAEEGYAYTDILKFYYPDSELMTIY